uniref:Uncharacterized protein n=1 Tax=Pipistrellus kuhlii TaxID=59472 RepID=A0A7J7WDR8_PIPKU|nr:hypothetical protein mPipKuh1_008041 [Pipistrellus kuhlii]
MSTSVSFPSGTPIIRILFCFVMSQSSRRLSSCFLIFFSRSCSTWVFFSILSSSSLMRSSASSSLLLMLSIEFFMVAMSFFISSWFFFNSSWFFLISSWLLSNFSSILFSQPMIIILNSCSGRLLTSGSFTSFSGDACFSFMCGLCFCLPMASLLRMSGYVVFLLLSATFLGGFYV